jgi:hypothetical protein
MDVDARPRSRRVVEVDDGEDVHAIAEPVGVLMSGAFGPIARPKPRRVWWLSVRGAMRSSITVSLMRAEYVSSVLC